PNRNPEPSHAQARLLLPVATRQPAVRAGVGRGRAGLRRHVVEVRPAPHRRNRRNPWASRICGRMAAPSRLRLGRRASSPQPAGVTSMKTKILRRAIVAGVLAASGVIGITVASPAYAQFGGIVYDPTNYAQNVLTAARSLQQINNQIQQIQNQ